MSDNTELESSDSVQSARNYGSGCMSGCGTICPSLGAEMIPTVSDSVDSAVLSESIDNAVEKPSPISDRWDKSVSLGISGLDQKSLCYWAINLGVGCMHGCLFCYVPEVSTACLYFRRVASAFAPTLPATHAFKNSATLLNCRG